LEQPNFPQLPQSTPEKQGVSSASISAFVAEVEASVRYLHSFMLVRHGQVIAQAWWHPYQPTDPHILFSLSKSFTSTAVGLAVAEAKLSVDDLVISFFPDKIQPSAQLDPNLATMQVKHLLTMNSGHAQDTMDAMIQRAAELGDARDWVRGFLSLPLDYQPGTHFVYNTAASYMLSAIVQQVTKQTLVEYLQPRLFEPLAIIPSWESSPQGINMGGFGLSLTTEGIAKFGQLYLQEGQWKGQTILSPEWVAQATGRQVASHSGDGSSANNPNSDWEQGYGYQFWRCRYGAYRGDGAFGQYCVVLPEQDAVLAITAGLPDMQIVLDLVWKHLLPAMGQTPLPLPSAQEQQALHQKLTNLELPLIEAAEANQSANAALAAQVSGRTYTCDPNSHGIKGLTLDFSTDQNFVLLEVEDEQGKHIVECGKEQWHLGSTTLNSGMRTGQHRFIGACGAWADLATYQIRLYYRTPVLPQPDFVGTAPFGLDIICHFAANELNVQWQYDQTFWADRSPHLQGRWLG
jgi:CubicO group peptidase (beta-lactamase class C family)